VTRSVLILLCLAAGGLAGCRSSCELSGGVAGGVIAHDACAVMLKIRLQVVDGQGRPVPGTEVWRRDPDTAADPHIYTKAWLFGVTGEDGRLEELYCYLGTSEYGFWRPDEKPVRLRLLSFRKGYSASDTTLAPDTAAVLEAGGLLEEPPGPEHAWKPRRWKESLASRAFVLDATIVLERTTEPSAPEGGGITMR
jgi:hypothetical protein